jgi:phosphotransferase system HPr (HPr) family protein
MEYAKECVVNDPLGIHGRPSRAIVNLATEAGVLSETVFINKENGGPLENADVTSIIGLMGLGATCGTVLKISTKKKEFHKVVDKLAAAIPEMKYD